MKYRFLAGILETATQRSSWLRKRTKCVVVCDGVQCPETVERPTMCKCENKSIQVHRIQYTQNTRGDSTTSSNLSQRIHGTSPTNRNRKSLLERITERLTISRTIHREPTKLSFSVVLCKCMSHTWRENRRHPIKVPEYRNRNL